MACINECSKYEEITVENKKALYEEHSCQKMTDEEFNNIMVKCIHCDKEFNLNEFKTVLEKPTGFVYISCKYYPQCDGSMIDFM